MLILHDILEKLKNEFAPSGKGHKRGIWFVYTLIAVIIPFTSSKTSNLLRCPQTFLGLPALPKNASTPSWFRPSFPGSSLWQSLWMMIPDPLTDGRLLLALDAYINPKTGKKIFGCNKVFDHAAKQNQSRHPWAQNIVTVGLLKMVKGRWACLPLNWRLYHLKKTLRI